MRNDRSLAVLLRAILAFTGACVLMVEILATRMLAPYFGSSLFSLSSVLGVTLGALSIGYFLGGILGERSPTWSKFGILVSLGACGVLVIWPSAELILSPLSIALPSGIGVLLASLILFTLPSVLLGMLSPYGIALEERYRKTVSASRIAGSLYFWSTLGSIAGSFAAGFLFIPLFGIRSIFVGIGCMLLLTGIMTIISSTAASRKKERTIILPMVMFALFTSSIPRFSSAIYETDGVYQHIAVTEGEIDDKPVRILWQDRNPSSGIRLYDDDHAFAYTRFVAAAWTERKAPTTSLVIGAGAFTIPRWIAASSDVATVDVVDIEPNLATIAEKYFRYIPSDRVRSIIDDGRVFLRGAGAYDLIVADAYQATYAIPTHLTTVEFFQLVKDHLTYDGVFIGNFIGSTDLDTGGYFPAVARTLLSVFPHGKFYGVVGNATTQVQNIMFIGCKEESCIDPCSTAMKRSTDPMLSTLCDRMVTIDTNTLQTSPLLTDNYAPVEWLTL